MLGTIDVGAHNSRHRQKGRKACSNQAIRQEGLTNKALHIVEARQILEMRGFRMSEQPLPVTEYMEKGRSITFFNSCRLAA